MIAAVSGTDGAGRREGRGPPRFVPRRQRFEPSDAETKDGRMAPRLLREELRRASPGRPSAFTIGTFDGVHRGHQFLIRLLHDRAAERGLASGAITLHPHPLTVVRPGTEVTYLTSLEERIELLRHLGLEVVAPVTFTSDVSQVSAEEF